MTKDERTPGRAWHFTSIVHLPRIMDTGKLRLTESNLDPSREGAGPSVVWLLDGPDLGGLPHGLAGSIVDKTEVRFEIETNPRWTARWADWADAQRIDAQWRDILVHVGGGQEASRRWLISFAEIPRSAWVRVDNTKTGETIWKREGETA